MTCVERTKNLISGLGGYENIASFRYDENSILHITVKDGKKVSQEIIRQDRCITGIDGDDREITVTMETGTGDGVFAVLNVPSIVREEPCRTNALGRKYTADYFMEIAEKAVSKMPVLQIEKNAVMGFVFMIAEEAARFANEKGLDNDFDFVPEFVSAVTNPQKKDGIIMISGNVFAYAEKKTYISVQYQRKGASETYNLLMTDMGTDDGVRYIGKIRGATNDGRQDTGNAVAVTKKDNDSTPKSAPAGLTKKTDSAVSPASGKEPIDETRGPSDEAVSTWLPLIIFVLIAIVIIFVASTFSSAPTLGQAGGDNAAGYSLQQTALPEEDAARIKDDTLKLTAYLGLTGILYIVFGLIGYLIIRCRWGAHNRGIAYVSSFVFWGIAIVVMSSFMESAVDAAIAMAVAGY